MLIRTHDTIRDLDRLAAQLFGLPLQGTATRPLSAPMDAWRAGETLHFELDLPGVTPETLELDIENSTLTIKAERRPANGEWRLLAGERAHGQLVRQVALGDHLDTDKLTAELSHGVLRITVPVAERARSRKVHIQVADPATPGAVETHSNNVALEDPGAVRAIDEAPAS